MITFLEFLEEARQSKPDALKTINRNWEKRNKGMTAYSSVDNKGDIRLKDIFVPPDMRNKKIGSRYMKGLSNYANKNQKNITLRQSPEKGKENDLKRFYDRHGFEKDSSKKGNYIRRPGK